MIPLPGTEGTIPGARAVVIRCCARGGMRSDGTCVESHAAATKDSVQPRLSSGDEGIVRMDTANVRDKPTAMPHVTLG